MSEVLTPASVDYKTAHLLPRLKASVDDAAEYIAASLQDNIDSPESIALAFQDVAQAYELPIDISIPNSERARLEREALNSLLAWHCEKDPSKRSAAWHRMISATNKLAVFLGKRKRSK